MTDQKWKVRILVNNTVGEGSCLGEHGLATAIEGGELEAGGFVLFDTGRSAEVLLNNAKAMGIDWSRLGPIVLSHSHYDHSGGLLGLRAHLGRNLTVIGHPDTFTTKANFKPKFRDIGIPFSRGQLISENMEFKESLKDTPLTPNLFLTGEIERVFDFEESSHKNLMRQEQGVYVPDHVPDDRALIIRRPGVGFHLICGCCHSGLLNTLKHASATSGERKVLTIIGGLHLGSYDDETLKRVIDQLAAWDPHRIVPLHCTGMRAAALLWKRFADKVEFRGAGDTIELD